MKDFTDFIDDMQIYPINFMGGSFTWSNKDGIMSKIDRIFGNSEWKHKFSFYIATFLPGGLSEHSPIILCTSEAPAQSRAPFKLFNHLLDHLGFLENLTTSWNITCNYRGVGNTWSKLKSVKNGLKSLHSLDISKISNKVNSWRALLHDAQSNVLNDPCSIKLLSVKKDSFDQFKKCY